MRRTIGLLLGTILMASPAAAGKRAGVTMQDTVEVGGKRLVLNGMGLREATALDLDIYVAGLYVETPSADPATLIAANETKRIVLRFKRDLDRGQIVNAWNEGFKANATVPLPTIQRDIDRFNGWMEAFDKGDTLALTYVPGQGVYVDVNGTRKGVIRGDDFARSMFAIWLGPKPPSAALKSGLLGKG